MRKVDEILTDIEAAQTILDKANEDIPIQVRAGWEIRKADARSAMGVLVPELEAATVPSRLVGCFVSGPDDLVAAAADTVRRNGGVVVRADAVWERIVANFEPSFGADRLFRTTQFWLMVNAYRVVASELGLPGTMPAEGAISDVVCATHDDSLALVRRQIRSWAGEELNLRAVRHAIVGAVMAHGIDAPKIPVLVTGAIPEEVPVLGTLFSRVVTHELGPDSEVTDDAIGALFKAPSNNKNTKNNSKDNGKDNNK